MRSAGPLKPDGAWVVVAGTTLVLALACDELPPPSTATVEAAQAPAQVVSVPYVAPSTPAPTLTFVPGSSVKLEQLLGEVDRERHQPTRNRTWTRYGIRGTDLGFSFEHQGKAYFLFGDTVGKVGRGLDTIATTDAVSPEGGVRLDFLTVGDRYLTIEPPGLSMAGFEVPVSGIDLGGVVYVLVRTNHTQPTGPVNTWDTDRTVVTRFTPPATFTPIREISRKFLTYSIHAQPAADPMPGLPPGGPYVLAWASATYRHSHVYLSLVPAAEFETGRGTMYFAGQDAAGSPRWSSHETDASPVVNDGAVGDVSVTFCKDLGLWLMTYDRRPPGRILFQWSRTPWGPWSERQEIFRREDGASFIHDPSRVPSDGLGGPTIGGIDPERTNGGMYAPYIVERWTRAHDGQMDIYWTLSTWNPYTVELMRSTFRVQ